MQGRGEIHVGRVVHPSINGRRREKVPTNFESIPGAYFSTTDEHGFISTHPPTPKALVDRKNAKPLAAC
jgi:hypothetical protein